MIENLNLSDLFFFTMPFIGTLTCYNKVIGWKEEEIIRVDGQCIKALLEFCSSRANLGRQVRMIKEERDFIQNIIGYKFKKPRLLEQAFTRKSYAKELAGIIDNEVLEFFGDKILAFYVVQEISKKSGNISDVGQYENKKNLGQISSRFNQTVKNENLEVCIKKLQFNKYMKVISAAEKKKGKPVADLFEAIVGAVAIDSEWNISKINTVVHNMLHARDLKLFSDEKNKTGSSVLVSEKLKDVCILVGEREPSYIINEIYPGRYKITANILLNNEIKEFSDYGDDVSKTMESVARLAYDWAFEKACKKVVGFQIENPVTQTEILWSSGLVGRPNYLITEVSHKNSVRSWYRCEFFFQGENQKFVCTNKIMEKAKRNAAALALESIGFKLDGRFDSGDVVRGQGLLRLILTKYKAVS